MFNDKHTSQILSVEFENGNKLITLAPAHVEGSLDELNYPYNPTDFGVVHQLKGYAS